MLPAAMLADSVVRMLAMNADLLAISEAEAETGCTLLQNCIFAAVVFLLQLRCRESVDPCGRPRYPMLILGNIRVVAWALSGCIF
jgi:hypothetical protein